MDIINTVETEERNAKIVRLRESGLTLRQIAARFGLSSWRVRQILIQNGAARSIVKTCALCNKTFITSKPNARYCSGKCRIKGIAAKAREYSLKVKARKPSLTKTCAVCNKPFTTKKIRQIVCSQECWVQRENDVVRLYESGLKLQQIATQLGIPYRKVRQIIAQAGIPIVSSTAKRTRNAEIVRLRESGVTLQQIAAQFGLSRERVKQIIVRYSPLYSSISFTKICPVCNTSFVTSKASSVYCSQRCLRKNKERKRLERMFSDPQYREKRNEYYKKYRMKYPNKHRQYLKQRYRKIKADPQKYEEYKRKCSQYTPAWYHRLKQDPQRYRRYQERQKL